MGAKVQFNTYFPGYYHMRDLNDDTRSTICSQFFDDRMMKSAQFCNGFMQHNRDGYSEYEKEMLKQTMLKHEAIFRKQVCELHRLYEVQKNLMDDLKRKEMMEYSLPLGTMHDGQCMLQVRSDNSEKICQMAMPSVGSSSCSRQSASKTDNMQSSLTLLRENSNLQKYSELQGFNINKLPRKTIDLRLTADEYIDVEDREASVEEVKVIEASSGSFFGIKYPVERNPNIVPESEVKLTLGPGLDVSTSGDHHRSETHLPHSIHVPEIELNVTQRNKEVATGFGVPDIFNNEIRAKKLHSQAGGSSFGLLKDHIQGSNTENIHRHCWNSLESECERSKAGRQSSNLRPGHCGSMDTSFAQRHGNSKVLCNFGKSHEISRFCSSEQQQESWFKDQHNTRAEFPSVNLIDPMAAGATSLSTSFPGTFSVISRPDLSDIASAELFTRNSASSSNQLPFGFQSPGNLDKSMGQNFRGRIPFTAFQGAEFSEEKWHPNASVRSCQRIDLEVPPRHDSFNLSARAADRSYSSFTSMGLGKLDLNNGECSSFGLSVDNGPRKLLKSMNSLDVKSNRSASLSLVLQNGFADDAASRNQSALLVDKEGKHGNILEGQINMWSHKAEMKTYPNNSLQSNDGIGHSSLGLSRPTHQPKLIIDLEKPLLEVESETEAPSERSTCDAGSVSQSNGGLGPIQQLVSYTDKNESTHVPEARIVQSSCRSRINFFMEPLVLQLPAESIKDCSKTNGFKTHKYVDEPQEGIHDDLKVHNFQMQASRNQADRHCTYEGSISTSLDLCEGKSICLEESVDERVTLFEVEHESTTMGIVSKEGKMGHVEQDIKSIAEGAPQDLGINLSEHSNRNLGKIHQLDLNCPGDVSLSQERESPAVFAEKISCTEMSKRFDCSLGDELRWSSGGCSVNSLVTMAAEALVSISSFSQEKSGHVARNEPEATLTDSLKWFADLVCPESGLLESNTKASTRSNGDDSYSSGEEDFFESMTLMLTENKMDKDYCYQSQPHQESGGPETDTSPAKNQPTRRAPRRGRRQRDFQRDILPGLMSLSRYEVSEDMQTICSLMKASGCFWQPAVARRNGYRNEWSSPTRGRRSRCISMAMEVNEAVLAVLQPTSDPEIVDETVSLKGFSWGKTTRRRRMQRCPSTVPTSCTTKKS